jgi:hypothetical protein
MEDEVCMKLSFLLLAVSAFWTPVTSAFGTCIGDSSFLMNYNGMIGDKYKVRVTITIIGDKVEGVYFYATQLKDIPLKGTIVDGRNITMDELDDAGNITGKFEGEFPERDPRGKFGSSKLQCDVMVGYWYRSDKPNIKLPFYLSEESRTGGTLKNRYGASNDDLIHHNAKRFWEAIKHGDKKMVASLINYPIKVGFHKRSKLIRNAKEMVENYDAIFTPAYVEAISKALPRNMFVRDQGIMLGNGEVWFNDNGKVITLNNQFWGQTRE